MSADVSAPPPRRDEGAALLMVLGVMTVLTLVVSVALAYALQSQDSAQRSTAWNQAFAAAEAGVDDYLARLNRDDNYWATVDCANAALKGATSRSNACGWTGGTAAGWQRVPGSDRAQFHYDVDVASTPVDGTIDLVATGRVDGVTRSIQVTLRRGGFGEFLYYTTYETRDPADYSNATQAYTDCGRYHWAGRASYCTDINFIGGDVLDGPMHSNDAILIGGNDASGKGPRFKGTVTTSRPQCKPGQPSTCYRSSTSNPRPVFDKGITYRSEVEIPQTITDLRQFVTGTSPRGCLYTGPTRIEFVAGGQMKVWSPYSRTALNPGCGNHLGAWPQTVSVPANGLVLVQNVPSSQAQPSSGACAAGAVGGYPVSGDYNATLPEANCRYGTIFVEGTLKGRVTLSADNNVVVTDDLVYAGGENGTDVLGLIAANSVQIYHPVGQTCQFSFLGICFEWSRTQQNLRAPDGALNTDPVVHASVLTLQHSFEVQAYDVGAELGAIHLYGSIAQRFRGLVGTSGSGSGGTGYLKDYHYDSRLRYAPPPYFLDPVRASWGQKTFGEIAPRYGG